MPKTSKSRAKGVVRGESGTSILEVVIAFAILGLSVEYSMGSVNANLRFNAEQEKTTDANFIATSLMEELFLRFENDPELSSGTHTRAYDADGAPIVASAGGDGTSVGATFKSEGGEYEAEWIVSPDTPFPKITKITVSVSWKEKLKVKTVEFVNFRI